MQDEQLHELLYQALESEVGGVAVYETAIKCADDDLKKEWEEYLEQTRNHHAVLETLFGDSGSIRRRNCGPRRGSSCRRVVGDGDGDGAGLGSPRSCPAGGRGERRER